jgi:tetratricopeptide (TPR) repeat protein
MWEKAAEAYTEALRLRRRRNDLRYSLGLAYAQLGKIDEAEQKYREILSLTPDDAEALKALQDLGKRY